jgi:hypothetical protein
MAKHSTILTGVAGEYFVAAELSRRGYIASITLRNSKGVDILVTNEEATANAGIQVKSKRQGGKHWLLNVKAESYESPRLFYVFVILGSPETRPIYHVVPSRVVAKYVRESHRTWLNTPGRGGRKHKDTSMRKFVDKDDEYFERWDLLQLEN